MRELQTLHGVSGFFFLNKIIVTLSLPSAWVNDESVVFGWPWLLIGADTYLKCFKYLCSCAIRGIQLSLRHLSDSVTGGSVQECAVWCGLHGTCAGRHGSCPVEHVLSCYTAGNERRLEGFISFVSFSASLLSSQPSCLLPSLTDRLYQAGKWLDYQSGRLDNHLQVSDAPKLPG